MELKQILENLGRDMERLDRAMRAPQETRSRDIHLALTQMKRSSQASVYAMEKEPYAYFVKRGQERREQLERTQTQTQPEVETPNKTPYDLYNGDFVSKRFMEVQ